MSQLTLSLNRRTHFFVKEGKLFIKLQRPNFRKADGKDFYILKTLPMSDLIKLRDWADQAIKKEACNESF